jgi:hypothetical protein
MKKYLFTLMLGTILIGTGVILSMFEFIQFNYSANYPANFSQIKEETDSYTLDNKNLDINLNNSDYYIIKDNNIQDKVIIKYYYFPEYIKLIKEDNYSNSFRNLNLDFELRYKNNTAYKDFYHLVIANLKDRQIYNYSLIFTPDIQISINPNDLNKINIVRD